MFSHSQHSCNATNGNYPPGKLDDLITPTPTIQMANHADKPPAILPEPEQFKYETGEQLGKGGFAICHKAQLIDGGKKTGHVLALKIVKSKMEPPKLAQKFVTELQIHSKLQHPNIVEFYRAFSFGESTYVVLEICDNGSLADALKKRRYFTMPEIRRFVIQTCGAVKYLHQRSIIHRDLKTGNLLLDSNMNIKVGDFGLAALLVSQNDIIGARRTTMCGTPNYLAPEILEKNGRGHCEKVDLWSIGIIAYTLAVGKAPFHAAKKEEIYKKLQTRDYSWPELTKSSNEISQDLRDLVGSLLVEEDNRPNPDQIVSHSFFRMGYVPAQLDRNCTSRPPKWGNIRPPTQETIRRGYSLDWYKICKESGVGEYAPGKYFPAIQKGKMRSAIRDCGREVELGLQPTMPFPDGVVYLPYPQRTKWPYGDPSADTSEEKESSEEGPQLAETRRNIAVRNRQPIQTIMESDENDSSSKENAEPPRAASGELRPTAVKPRRTKTLRSVIDQAPSRTTPVAPVPRTVKLPAPIQVSKHRPRSTTTKMDPIQEDQGINNLQVQGLPPKASTISKATAPPSRIRRTALKPSILPQDEMPPPSEVHLPTRVASASYNRPRSRDPSLVHETSPNEVLDRAARFRDNIAKALANKSVARKRSPDEQIPMVSKWVDYAKKHGVAYVLEDGSIGVAMNATQRHPVTHVIVRNGLNHLKKVVKDPYYLENVPFEFFIDGGADGLRLVDVDEDRKRAGALLWSKFGKYMCQKLGSTEERLSLENSEAKTTIFVRFYQRLGSVQVWGFSDGTFQFNFPDHTKLVLSADATYCNFTCLSLEATRYLAENGDLPARYIRQRNILSSTLRNLLHGSDRETVSYQEVTQPNLLKRKLGFIVDVFDEWIDNGGLGCLSENGKLLKWEGPQLEDTRRQDWVTIGRFGGDDLRG